MQSTTATSDSLYNVSLPSAKKGVFVTQSNRLGEGDNARRFPMVHNKESADMLLLSSSKALETTSLLRQAIRVEHVDCELAEKRKEFRERMEVCQAKERQLKVWRQKIKERVARFDRFLEENEAKRKRATEKYQQERKENKQKRKELAVLNKELGTLRRQDEVLKKRLERNSVYLLYLKKVADVLPENYIEMTGESIIQSIIHRHEGLSATNQFLTEANQTVLAYLESGQKELENLRQETHKQKLIINIEMAALQKLKESIFDRNKIMEQKAAAHFRKMRNVMGKLGRILIGIDNLAYRSHRRRWPALINMNYIQKLSLIRDYVLERMGVDKMVEEMMQVEGEIDLSAAQSSSNATDTTLDCSLQKGRSHRHSSPIKFRRANSRAAPASCSGDGARGTHRKGKI